MSYKPVHRINSTGGTIVKQVRSDDWWFIDNINHWAKRNRPSGPPRVHKPYKKRGAKRVVDGTDLEYTPNPKSNPKYGFNRVPKI